MNSSTWALSSADVASKYGGSWMRQQSASPAVAGGMTELASVNKAATAPASGIKGALESGSGLIAFGGLAAISLGLMAFATTVRIGHAEGHVGVGKV